MSEAPNAVPTGVVPRKSVQQLYDEHYAGKADTGVDPCPQCTPGVTCRTPKCGRLKLAAAAAEPALKDSGERREVGTGAVRDRSSGKGRFDLLPLFGILAVAAQMERGAEKYKARNWEAGMPLSWFADSGKRHLEKFLAGFDDEPHLDAALWNLACLAEGRERIKRGLWPAELDDLPKTYAGLQPGF